MCFSHLNSICRTTLEPGVLINVECTQRNALCRQSARNWMDRNVDCIFFLLVVSQRVEREGR